MNEYPATPILSQHARERCAEMGIRTRVAKDIVRHADVVRAGKRGDDALMATSDRYPEYAVVFGPRDPPIIVTVLFREQETYVRNGSTYSTPSLDSD